MSNNNGTSLFYHSTDRRVGHHYNQIKYLPLIVKRVRFILTEEKIASPLIN